MIDFLMEEEGKRDHADDVCEMDDVIPGEVEWSRGEDEYLQKIVGLYGTEEWRTIMEKFNNRFCNHSRTEAECRNRWNEFLDPRNSKKPWDDNEQFMMLVAHKKFKNKWSDVATTLPGRSGNTIKNRFYCIFRKVKNKILKFDLSYTSKFELLEILYMISLMEQYSVEFFITCLKTPGEPYSAEVRYQTQMGRSPGLSPIFPMTAGGSIGSLLSFHGQYEGFSDFTKKPGYLSGKTQTVSNMVQHPPAFGSPPFFRQQAPIIRPLILRRPPNT